MTALPSAARALEIAGALSATRFRWVKEADLHRGMIELFTRLGVPFRHEVELGAAGRIDFVIDGSLGLEVKIDGGLSPLLRQLARYAQVPSLSSLLLVTSKPHLAALPRELGGKPLVAVTLLGSLL